VYRFNHPSAPNTSPDQKPEQSNPSTTAGRISWKKVVALSAVPLALLFGAAFQSSNSVPGQLQAIQAQLSGLQAQVASVANKGPRKFYLTKSGSDGAHALSACAMGYHMASLWEIHDTSNLRYDTVLGLTTGDSGFGPPSRYGWIRTGELANDGSSTSTAGAGVANCNGWISAGAVDHGTVVAPVYSWNGAGRVIGPWDTLVNSCGVTAAGVWCVEN